MADPHHRQKLLHAINFFVRNTKHCHSQKVFKLLSCLDFEHHKQTGHSVTGLTYRAWETGPVPAALFHELKAPKDDFKQTISITSIKDERTSVLVRTDIEPVAPFGQHFF